MMAAARNEAEPQAIRLGLLAHDLRTPISCICGAAQMAMESARHGARVEEYLTQILSAVNTLDAMTSELMAAGAVCEPFDGGALERELRALMAPQAEARAQRLTLRMSALAGRRFRGDLAALTRILTNLLSNAIKYTPRGGRIDVRARLTGDGEGMEAVFTVRDNGVGMTEAFMERLYQPFARAKETESVEGHGLGLTSVRRLAERMGGTVDVRSRCGEGTTVTVRVPLREA